MTQITTASELQAKLEKNRYDYFTFPQLEITVKYRTPDMLKLSFQNQLPSVMADTIIEAYRELVGGSTEADIKNTLQEKQAKFKADDDYLKDLASKGYNLLKELCVSHKVWEVEFSDPENDLISWKDIPEVDALAFLMHIVQKAQQVQTKGGGVSSEELTSFPEGTRSKKRRVARKAG
jgi:hypothetical protein